MFWHSLGPLLNFIDHRKWLDLNYLSKYIPALQASRGWYRKALLASLSGWQALRGQRVVGWLGASCHWPRAGWRLPVYLSPSGQGWWVWHVTNVPGDLVCRGEHQLSWLQSHFFLQLVLAVEYPCQRALAGSSLFQLFLLCERDKSNVLPVLDYTAVCCCLGPP